MVPIAKFLRICGLIAVIGIGDRATASELPSLPAGPCVEWLGARLEQEGYRLRWVDLRPSDGPSVVDAIEAMHPASDEVLVGRRGQTVHVRAPFLSYRQARALVMSAERIRDRPIECAVATQVAVAARGEDAMRAGLIAVAVLATALGVAALRRRQPT